MPIHRGRLARLPALLVMAALVLALGLRTAPCAAQSVHLDADTIKAALRTTAIEENGFVDRVVKQVDEGKLPAHILYSAFLWAKKKPKNKFQYFRYALIVLAAQIGKQVE